MNCLYISPVAPPYGGLANQTLLISSSSLFKRLNFKIVRSNPPRKVERPGAFSRLFSLWPIKMYKEISESIRENSPDIIFVSANGDISFLRNVFLGYTASKRCNAPLVIHMHASRRGFWHDRHVGSTSEPGLIKTSLNALGYKLVNILLNKASAFSQLTSDIDQYYQRVGLRSATHIIPNTVLLRNPDVSLRKANKFIFVGRLSREKGFFDLLEALSLLADSNWSLDVLGSPVCSADKESIRVILAEHPYRDQIRLHGTIKGEEKWKFFDSSSFLVLPTHLEVFPIVILEAMASGLAVISTPIGEIETILPDQGRILIQPGDISKLCSSIATFLDSPNVVAKMGKSNLEKVNEYGLEFVAKQFETMLIETQKNTENRR